MRDESIFWRLYHGSSNFLALEEIWKLIFFNKNQYTHSNSPDKGQIFLVLFRTAMPTKF